MTPGSLIAIQNTQPGVELLRFDPHAGTTTTLLTLTSTSLGNDLRAQDQASLAVSDDGTSAWFVASYNLEVGPPRPPPARRPRPAALRRTRAHARRRRRRRRYRARRERRRASREIALSRR